MDVSGWLQDKFGSVDTQTLLNESLYSSEELEQDKYKLESELSELESSFETHETRYKYFLDKGVKVSDYKQEQFAQKARIEKKKYKAKKKQYKQISIKLGTVIAIEGVREISSLHSEDEYHIDDHLENGIDTTALQHELMDQMTDVGLNVEDMKAVQNALDLEIIDDPVEFEAVEEKEIIQQMEQENLSSEEISIEDEVTTNTLSETDGTGSVTEDESEFDIEDDVEDHIDIELENVDEQEDLLL